jgi:hypothetical protein
MPELEGEHPLGERLNDVAVRLEIIQAMAATIIAVVLRTANDDHRRQIIEELRRNILLGVARINPNGGPAEMLICEEATDRLLDEVLRLSHNIDPLSPRKST